MALDTLLKRLIAPAALVAAMSAAPTAAQAQQCAEVDHQLYRDAKYAIIEGNLYAQHADGFTVYLGRTSAKQVTPGGDAKFTPQATQATSFNANADLVAALKKAGFQIAVDDKIAQSYCRAPQ